jgi:hypothetical protein
MISISSAWMDECSLFFQCLSNQLQRVSHTSSCNVLRLLRLSSRRWKGASPARSVPSGRSGNFKLNRGTGGRIKKKGVSDPIVVHMTSLSKSVASHFTAVQLAK